MRWTATLLLLVAACGRPADRPEPLSDPPPRSEPPSKARSHRAWLELYDAAGFPDVSRLRRVEIETGRSRSADGVEAVEFERAWVLSTSPLVLLQDSLSQLECAAELPESMRAPAQAVVDASEQPHREPRSYREVDFADELRAELDAVEDLPDKDAFKLPTLLGPPATYWLVRARWAEMRGATELSRRALAQIERWSAIECNQDCSVEVAIRNGFQEKLLWQANYGIGGVMPRPQARELVIRARAIAPHGAHATEVAELLDRLNRTIATDANGGDAGRVEHLIFLLREQGGHHQSGPTGFCDPSAGVGPIRDPAAELRDIGREAIPALIEHIDDDTTTRSLAFFLGDHFYESILSVGDVALDIIEQIAGRRFDLDDEVSSQMSGADKAKAIQRLVREWWAEARELSAEAQLLRDLDDAEESERDLIAANLLEKHGMASWPELIRVFGETKDDKARANLLRAMDRRSKISHERAAVERFLIEALEDRSITVRLAAAQALAERGRHEGTTAMIHDQDRLAWDEPATIRDYVALLLTDGSAAAVDAIDHAVRARGHAAMSALVLACGGNDSCGHELDPAAKARLLDTLAGSLAVGTYVTGTQRIRDKAAEAYARLTDQATDVVASSRVTSVERDRVILDMLNAHRAQQRQPPVSWPHVAPPQGTPGRDHVQRVHLLHASAHEAEAREWLGGFADRDLDPREITTALAGLAWRHPEVPFTLRIHRFPADAGVILTLEVGVRAPSTSRGYIQGVAICVGSGVTHAIYSSEPAAEVFTDFLRADFDAAWNQAPTRIEEYVFQVKASRADALSALGCECTVTGDSDGGWFLVIGGLVLGGLGRRRRFVGDIRVGSHRSRRA